MTNLSEYLSRVRDRTNPNYSADLPQIVCYQTLQPDGTKLFVPVQDIREKPHTIVREGRKRTQA